MERTGPVVLVVGAGSGLGQETALALAARGYRVFGSVLTPGERADLEAQCARRGLQLEIVAMDVTQEPGVRESVDRIVSTCGRIDALVCFAGLGLRGETHQRIDPPAGGHDP